jgi:hypothetical protein
MKFRSLILVYAAAFAISAAAQTVNIYSINGRIPLGIESFRMRPGGHDFYLIASAENPAFQGLHRDTDRAGHDHLLDADGKPIEFYPSRLQFRLTASDREKLRDDHPFEAPAKGSVPELISHLRFRLKVFHELSYRVISPTLVQDIGMPNNVPYDERIYRIGFDLGKIPIEDRVVMEVLAPNGERLCKFHLDLM